MNRSNKSINADRLFRFRYKSHKGKEKYIRLAKYSLGGLSTVLIVLILFGIFSERWTDKKRSERIKEEEITTIENKFELTSAGETEFSIDTFTKNQKVEVNSFQTIDQ